MRQVDQGSGSDIFRSSGQIKREPAIVTVYLGFEYGIVKLESRKIDIQSFPA